jgi:hypothetical protein
VAPCRADARASLPAQFQLSELVQQSKGDHMDHDNRVLTRRGARELTQDEVEGVQGALIVRHTLTPCFIDKKQQLLNGDQAIGECGG